MSARGGEVLERAHELDALDVGDEVLVQPRTCCALVRIEQRELRSVRFQVGQEMRRFRLRERHEVVERSRSLRFALHLP